MLSTRRKRRITNIKRNPLSEHIEQMNKDWKALFASPELAKDFKFLRRMAINIKQLHHDAKRTSEFGELKTLAGQITQFLSTPLGAPFRAKETLVRAADLFSVQDPQDSDLSEILQKFTSKQLPKYF